MDAAGLLLGVAAWAQAAAPWLYRDLAIAVAGAAAATLVLTCVLAYGRRRRRAPRKPASADPARALKERLRQRLAQPVEIFAGSTAAGPTLGASEAIEGDLDAAAREVLPEAGWRCGALRSALRTRRRGAGRRACRAARPG